MILEPSYANAYTILRALLMQINYNVNALPFNSALIILTIFGTLISHDQLSRLLIAFVFDFYRIVQTVVNHVSRHLFPGDQTFDFPLDYIFLNTMITLPSSIGNAVSIQ